jgi:GNAT superfamily N-acetyltransferase
MILKPLNDQFLWSLRPIQELNPDEIRGITNLVIQANRAKPRIFPADRLREGDLVAEYGTEEILLALSTSEIAGCVILSKLNDALWLSLLAVAPEHQGKGLGRQILAQAERVAADRALSELAFDAVDGGNLISYYQSLGFRERSRNTKPIGHWGAPIPFDLVRMVRPVDRVIDKPSHP